MANTCWVQDPKSGVRRLVENRESLAKLLSDVATEMFPANLTSKGPFGTCLSVELAQQFHDHLLLVLGMTGTLRHL